MKKRTFFIATPVLLVALSLQARGGSQHYRAALTVHNSGRNAQTYNKPCVIFEEEGPSSIQGILSDLNASLNPGNGRTSAPICLIRNSPATRLVMIKPKDLKKNSLRSDLVESISTKINGNLILSIPSRKHVMINGYVPMFRNKALGGECDVCAWGGCAAGLLGSGDMDNNAENCPIETFSIDSANTAIFNWYEGCRLYKSYVNSVYTETDQNMGNHPTPPDKFCSERTGATMHALNYSEHKEQYRDAVGHHYRYGHWVDFPFVSSLIDDDLNPDKNPIFNCDYYTSHGATTLCKPETDDMPSNKKGYRGKIVIEDGALTFNVSGKLSLRYLDIYLRSPNAKVRFFGSGTVELKGVSIYGEASTDAMVEADENITFNIKKIPDRENALFGYGLGLFPQHSGIEKYFIFHSAPKNSMKAINLLMETWDNFPEFNPVSQHPAFFLAPATEGTNPTLFGYSGTSVPRENILCRLHSTEYDGTKICALNIPSNQMPHSVFAMEKMDGGANASHIYHFGLKLIPVINGAISFKGDPQLYSFVGNSIQVKETQTDPALVQAVMDIIGNRNRINRIHDVLVLRDGVLPAENLPCPEGTHWDGAFEQCMSDERPHDPDCGEARWDTTLEDCECDSDNKIYDDATKSCRMDDGAGLPDPDDGAEEVDDEDLKDPAGGENNSGGCSLTSANTMNPFPFILFPLLLGLLFFIRQRTRRIL